MIHMVLMPRLGANIDSVKVVEWLKSVGDHVQKGDVLADLETEKSAFELESDETGILRHIGVETDVEIPYNVPLAIIAGPDDDITEAVREMESMQASESLGYVNAMDQGVFDLGAGEGDEAASAAPSAEKKRGTPKALKLAEAEGLGEGELAALALSSKRGFVTERDVRAYLALPPTYIYGASTGAKQILEIIASGQAMRVAGIIDDNPNLHGMSIRGLPVLGGIEALEDIVAQVGEGTVQVAVSSHSHNRKKIFDKLKERVPSVALPPLVDRRSVILGDVEIGDGVLIEAGCVIGHEVKIGDGAILNLGAKMSHNCTIGAFTHMAIGTNVSGAVVIGTNCFIGAGVSINPAVRIGDGSLVTPGSAVLNDLPDNVTASGHPAHVIGDSKRSTA